jgi:putative FmdB family regulatory protein
MPLYEYECESCHNRFERIQKFSDPPIDTCPVCGKGPVKKLLSSPAIQFKGSGWYITDYAKKSSSDGGSSATSTSGDKKSDKTEKTDSTKKTDASSASSSTTSSTNTTKSES